MLTRRLILLLVALVPVSVPNVLLAQTSCTRSTGTYYQESGDCGGVIARPWTRYRCDDGSDYMFWGTASWDTKPRCQIYAE